MSVRATLVTDGSSDVVLLRILEWLLIQLTDEPIEVKWADVRGLLPQRSSLEQKLGAAIQMHPCDMLFVHRDAENQAPALRYQEISAANRTGLQHVCVVPVRMQEAWLLHNETALREAAGRPSGAEPLNLPAANRWEQLADPKDVLHTALRIAHGGRGRRARSFRPARAAHRLADLITDWAPLRNAPAFLRLEDDIRTALLAQAIPLRNGT